MAHRPGHGARQPRLNHGEHRQPGVSAVDAVAAPLADATAATDGRDPRDWLHAASLPAADRDRERRPAEFPITEYLRLSKWADASQCRVRFPVVCARRRWPRG